MKRVYHRTIKESTPVDVVTPGECETSHPPPGEPRTIGACGDPRGRPPAGYIFDNTGKLIEIQKSTPEQLRRKAHLGIVRISVTGDDCKTSSKVRICPHGTIVSEGGTVRTKPPQSGANRGVITEWSKQSRARLRKLLAESDGPKGWVPMGMTGTIPGDIISEADFRRLWQTFRRVCPPVPVVWRVELQTRKQPHVHVVTWLPPDTQDDIKSAFLRAWSTSVRRLGLVNWTGKDGTVFSGSRMAMPGADVHAVSLDTLEEKDDFGWWRYLASHQGKSKQDQLGWTGRNWGILHPEQLEKNSGDVYGLTRHQWFWLRRRLRKLTSYRGAGAGTKSVWYVRPDTMRTLVHLARLS